MANINWTFSHRNFLQDPTRKHRLYRHIQYGYVWPSAETSSLDSSSPAGGGETETEGKEKEDESSSPLSDITGNLPSKEKSMSEIQPSFITSDWLQSLELETFSSSGGVGKRGFASSDSAPVFSPSSCRSFIRPYKWLSIHCYWQPQSWEFKEAL